VCSAWDLTLVSADGISFNVHRKNLSVHSAIFADADAISKAAQDVGVVTLPETADVLGLLLKFMYRQRQPVMDDVAFGTIADLIKSAEKYEVFAAIHRSEQASRYVCCCNKKLRVMVSVLTEFTGKPCHKSQLLQKPFRFLLML
jgi:hypothetical protein